MDGSAMAAPLRKAQERTDSAIVLPLRAAILSMGPPHCTGLCERTPRAMKEFLRHVRIAPAQFCDVRMAVDPVTLWRGANYDLLSRSRYAPRVRSCPSLSSAKPAWRASRR